MEEITMNKSKVIYAVGVVIGLFLIQTVIFHKFKGSEESIQIFTKMGMEPWGRYLIGSVELICGILFLIPSLASFVAIVTAGTMLGAIGGHLGPVGISIGSSGPGLFITAIVILILCIGIIISDKERLILILQKVSQKFKK